MSRLTCLVVLAASIVLLAAPPLTPPVLAQQAAYQPGPQNITLPADWEARFIRYATVDNPTRKIVRHLYVNPEAFAAARPGQPLPDGTVIIMADARARLGADGNPLLDQQGRFIVQPGWLAVAAQQKEPGWGEGYPPEKRNGTWEYARFKPDGSRDAVSMDPCFTCHIQNRSQQDFAFNFWDYVQARK
jgi:Cytochrome P460